MKYLKSPQDDTPVDVVLLLESTYPYVQGGVSSWVQQLMRGRPETRFGAVFLGSRRVDYGDPLYVFPDNLVYVAEHFLMERWTAARSSPRRGDSETFKLSDRLHQMFKQGSQVDVNALLAGICELVKRADVRNLREDFLHSEESWRQITDYYERYCTDPSFVDYFWSVRTMHAALFDLIDIALHLPPMRVLHAVTNGYAGFLGALIHNLHRTPLILTEHGIYTKERRIDLAQAEWIRDARGTMEASMRQDVSHVRQLWIRFFEGLGRMTYASSAHITALYEGNRRQQLLDGAPPERSRIVPNGIDVRKYRPLREQRAERTPRVVALIGRIAPIKDIKTFVRAMRSICAVEPDVVGWIVGPADEDPLYLSDCMALAEDLGLNENVEFLGFREMTAVLPKIGVLVLSSISEAQPLVVLEGFAAGVPAVTTDVGCCADLINGFEGDEIDRAIGAAGRVVPIANPQRLADAVLELLRDEDEWKRAQAAAIRRVEAYYDETVMLDRYLELYRQTALPLPTGVR